MWYVIQTFSGDEERTADMIRCQIPSCYIEECFIPKRERMKKFCGVWNKVEEIIFQGYVFADSYRPEELYQELRRIPKLTKVLGREDANFFPLNETEERLIRRIGDENHKTGISRIEIHGERKIRVIEGPLKNYVGDVIKVNLHKREVVARMEFMGKPVELFMGVEMVDTCI